MEQSSKRGHLYFIQPVDMVAESWISVCKVFGICVSLLETMYMLLLCLVSNGVLPSLVLWIPRVLDLSRNSSLLSGPGPDWWYFLPALQAVSSQSEVTLAVVSASLHDADWALGGQGSKVPSKDTSWVQEALTISLCFCHGTSVPALGNPVGILPGAPGCNRRCSASPGVTSGNPWQNLGTSQHPLSTPGWPLPALCNSLQVQLPWA